MISIMASSSLPLQVPSFQELELTQRPHVDERTIAEINGLLVCRSTTTTLAAHAAASIPLAALAVEAPLLALHDSRVAVTQEASTEPAPPSAWHPLRPWLAVADPATGKVLVFDLSATLGGAGADAKAREALGANAAMRRSGMPPDALKPVLELSHAGVSHVSALAWRPRHPGQLLAACEGGYVLWTVCSPAAYVRPVSNSQSEGAAVRFGKHARGGAAAQPHPNATTSNTTAAAGDLASLAAFETAVLTKADATAASSSARFFASASAGNASRVVWRPDGRMAAAVGSCSKRDVATAYPRSKSPVSTLLEWVGEFLPSLGTASVHLICPADGDGVQTVRTDAVDCTDAAFSPCGRYLLVVGASGRLRLYSTERFESVAFSLGESVAGVAWAPVQDTDEATAVVVLTGGTALSLVVPSAPPARTAALLPLTLPALPRLAQEKEGCKGVSWDARGLRLVINLGGGEAAVYQTVHTPVLVAHLMGFVRAFDTGRTQPSAFAFHPSWPRGALLAASMSGEGSAAVVPMVMDGA